MADTQSQDEVRAEQVRMMGRDLGSLYHELWREVTWLHLKWRRCVVLFGGEKSTVDLMNDTAPAFFSEVQRAMVEDVLLHISRLTDPPATGHGKGARPNLTLLRLPEALADEAARDIVVSRLGGLCDGCAFARDRRNRWIAHRDLAVAMQTAHYKPLDSPTREKIEKALAGIRDVMNAVLARFRNSRTLYEYSADGPGSAEDLIYYLREGFEARRRQLAELQASVRPQSTQG